MWTHGLGTLVLCGLFQFGSTIMCYECNSAINSFCSEKIIPDSLKRNCSEHDKGVTHTLCRYQGCKKIIQHVDHDVNGKIPESRVIRSCGWDDSRFKGKCYHRAGYGGRQEVCSCTTDYCNSGYHITVDFYLLLTTTFTVVVSKICE